MKISLINILKSPFLIKVNKGKKATNTWTENFAMAFFDPNKLETNGSHKGSISIKQAVAECSCSSSFIEALMSKANKKKITELTWIVLLYDYDYSVKETGANKDKYLNFLGSFDYDSKAESLNKS